VRAATLAAVIVLILGTPFNPGAQPAPSKGEHWAVVIGAGHSPGRATLASSRPSEISTEVPDLGHGISTHYLVEGLKGDADVDRNGIVTLQEIYEYVRQRVEQRSRAIGGNQHPVMNGELDGALPLTKVRRP
jgi:hypothetical protein